MKSIHTTCAILALSVSSFAQVTPIGPFTGALQEDFEGPQVIFTPCMPAGVFGGAVSMCTPNNSGCHTTTGWGFQCNIYAYQNAWFFGSAGGAVELTFPTPATKFGGFFGVNSGFADATVDFYDASNTLLGSVTATIPADCSWNWNGWSIPAGASRILITGLNPYGGGFVDMDALEADTSSAPTPPVVYCTAGTSYYSCVAEISATGNPNVAHTAPCDIEVDQMEGQQNGLLFYGASAQATPWCTSGGSSFLCVKAPIVRGLVQNSGGTVGAACDGMIQVDWNAFQIGLGNTWTAGSKAFVQGWFRDPPSCKTSSLSDAVELTYQP